MPDLILNLKKKYFDQIKSGVKHFEYREVKPYWTKRLSKNYTGLQIRLGYPKNTDKSRIIKFRWIPNTIQVKTMHLMEDGQKTVYAIPLYTANQD